MAFVVENKGSGDFRIRIGDGKRHYADSIQEVALAMEHYFRKGRISDLVRHTNAGVRRCPFCRESRNEEAA